MKKKHKVKNIVVPGLEWMSDIKEVNEGKGVEKVLKMAKSKRVEESKKVWQNRKEEIIRASKNRKVEIIGEGEKIES